MGKKAQRARTGRRETTESRARKISPLRKRATGRIVVRKMSPNDGSPSASCGGSFGALVSSMGKTARKKLKFASAKAEAWCSAGGGPSKATSSTSSGGAGFKPVPTPSTGARFKNDQNGKKQTLSTIDETKKASLSPVPLAVETNAEATKEEANEEGEEEYEADLTEEGTKASDVASLGECCSINSETMDYLLECPLDSDVYQKFPDDISDGGVVELTVSPEELVEDANQAQVELNSSEVRADADEQEAEFLRNFTQDDMDLLESFEATDDDMELDSCALSMQTLWTESASEASQDECDDSSSLPVDCTRGIYMLRKGRLVPNDLIELFEKMLHAYAAFLRDSSTMELKKFFETVWNQIKIECEELLAEYSGKETSLAYNNSVLDGLLLGLFAIEKAFVLTEPKAVAFFSFELPVNRFILLIDSANAKQAHVIFFAVSFIPRIISGSIHTREGRI